MIGVGKEQGGLFLLQQHKSLDSSPHPSSHAHSTQITTPSIDIWHSRLGHLSNNRLQLLQNIVSEISFDSKHVCTICPLARQHRLPFVSSSSVSVSHLIAFCKL
jgi:hypothetical protein